MFSLDNLSRPSCLREGLPERSLPVAEGALNLRGGHEKEASSHWRRYEIVGLLGTKYNTLGQQFNIFSCLAPLGIYGLYNSM